jgi:hypothetical protein
LVSHGLPAASGSPLRELAKYAARRCTHLAGLRKICAKAASARAHRRAVVLSIPMMFCKIAANIQVIRPRSSVQTAPALAWAALNFRRWSCKIDASKFELKLGLFFRQ